MPKRTGLESIKIAESGQEIIIGNTSITEDMAEEGLEFLDPETEEAAMNEELKQLLDETDPDEDESERDIPGEDLEEDIPQGASAANQSNNVEETVPEGKASVSQAESKDRPKRTRESQKATGPVYLGNDLMPEAYHEQQKKIFTPVEDWKSVKACIASRALVRATVTAVDDEDDKVYVELGNIRGIIPKSEAGLTKETPSLVWMVGRTICFVIKAADQKNGFFVASRAEGLAALSEAVKKQLKIGEIRTGAVSRIERWGAWIELGGIYARLPRRELVHHFVSNVEDIIKPGDVIDVKVTHISSTGRVTVSLKETLPDPWMKVSAKYKVGMSVLGKVTGFLPNVVFVQIEPGVDTIARFPAFALDLDQKVSVTIRSIDTEKKRMVGRIRRVVQG